MNLRNYNFQHDEIINLSGEWNFYFRRLVQPDAIESEPLTGYVPVPSSWNGIVLQGLTIPGTACATYRLRVLLPPDIPARSLAIRSVLQMTAHRIFVNGIKIAEMGQPSCYPEESIARTKPLVAQIPTDSPELDIVLHISNFVHRRGGPLGTLKLGFYEELHRATLLNRYLEIFTFGILVFAGVTYLLIYLTRRTEKIALLFAVFSFLVLLRLLVTGEKILLDLFPETPYTLMVFLEFNSWFFLAPTGMHFVTSFFPEYWKRLRLFISYLLATGFCLFSIITPLRVYSYAMYPYTIITILHFFAVGYILLRALTAKRTYAIPLSIGVAIMLFFAINDILYIFELFKGGVLLHFGYLGLVGMNSLILAHKYIRSFSHSENLSKELAKLNANQEKIISENTRQIMVEQQTALRNLELKNHFLALVSHDLRNPLSVISGYLELLHDKNNKPDAALEEKIRRRAEHALKSIVHMIDAVFTYDRLKTGSIEINRKPVRINQLLDDVIQLVEIPAQDKEIHIVHKQESELVVDADYLLTKEILYNLLLNAIRFSPEKSTVFVFAEDQGARVAITVQDQGAGITAEQQKEIFNFRSSREPEHGGLSLPLCRAIAEAINAQLKLESEPGKGSRFSLVLPK